MNDHIPLTTTDNGASPASRQAGNRTPGFAPGGQRSQAALAARSLRRKRRKSRQRLALGLALVVLAALGGWWAFELWFPQASSDMPETAKVVRRDFASSVLATGVVQPQIGAEVRVGARLSGKVERLLANVGDKVEKGQVVAQLEKDDLEATVAQREAELRLAEAKLDSVKTLTPKEIEKAELELEERLATVMYTEQMLARTRRLHQAQVITEDDLDQAEERHKVASARVASARKALELAESRYAEDLRQARAEVDRARFVLANAKVQLSYATITAPINGVIASVSTEEGETVAAGMQAPTFVTIIDLNRLQVDAYVDEVDIGRVEVGQRVMFTVDAFPSMEFEGTVSAIYPKAVIQDNVVNYDVVIDIETPYHGLLRPEMTTSVTIFLDNREGVLAVPVQAVKRDQGKTVVYLPGEAGAIRREIKTGWRDGQWIEVASGLDEGQVVFLEVPGGQAQSNQELP